METCCTTNVAEIEFFYLYKCCTTITDFIKNRPLSMKAAVNHIERGHVMNLS